MEKINVDEIKTRLQTLTVFRSLLSDKVLQALCAYLNQEKGAGIGAYADFVSVLYEANGGHIGTYVKELVDNHENVFMRLTGCGKTPAEYMKHSLEKELKTLQAVADLEPKELQAWLEERHLLKVSQDNVFLPEYGFGQVDIAGSFWERAKNIGKYGYGMYAKNPMFYIDEEGKIIPVKNPDKISLSSFADYEMERQKILDNTKALLAGKPAANILLTGDAGTGKSSTIKAVVNELYAEGLRIIEVRKDQLRIIPRILDELAENPLKFILFIDDLSYRKDDDNFNGLKGVLEGSVSARSKNVVIYATSNRRHIIKETFSDREGDDIHRNDTMQEMISLSQRFGLHITFQKPNKETFLHIVRHLAAEKCVSMEDEELALLAERFAIERGGRSPRLARQFVDNLIARKE